MSGWKKLASAAAGAGGGLNVEDVFSTYLYEGDGTNNRAITTNIDTDTEGGLVWIKNRSQSFDHELVDSERGDKQVLRSNRNGAEYNDNNAAVLTSTGFTISGGAGGNGSGDDFVSWTFRKAPKFFDVVTYTGNGTAGRTVSHNLGSTPGCIIIKATTTNAEWSVYHRGMNSTYPQNYYMWLNHTYAVASSAGYWNNTAPTSTEFTLGNNLNVNSSGQTYVAYIFAHNDGDGEFGPTSDQDAIKCGSYSGNGSTNGPEIDLGFEPQWIMVKNNSGTDDWIIVDAMRGIVAGGIDPTLDANNNLAELVALNYFQLTPTGFKLASSRDEVNRSGFTYSYIAIRRGPMAVPESATDVFHVEEKTNPNSFVTSNFVTDFAWHKKTSATDGHYAFTRLTGETKYLQINSNLAEGSTSNSAYYTTFDHMDGVDFNLYGSQTNDTAFWMLKRAPNFFDVVAYTGTGTYGDTINHNLGATPEMMWVKRRNGTSEWHIYHKGIDVDGDGTDDADVIYFDSAAPVSNNRFAFTPPTDTVFSVGGTSDTNGSSIPYIAYLFASLDGISKVGSYTGTGSSQNIDCGFSSGARFILLRRADSTASHWYLFDAERGITTGSDPTILPSSNSAEVSVSAVAPYSSGFTVTATNNIFNGSGINYIFYAIA